jgi:vitamin B12/bleomycin/antimicrobial peptide transport system ATP-binding/permease protein
MIATENRAWVRSLQTIRLFFSSKSEARWPAIGWFALLLTVLLSFSGLNVLNSYVGRDFMTSISEKNWQGFVTYGIVYLVVFGVSTVMSTFSRFSEERLRLLWRGWLTRLLIDLYMSRDRFYRLKALEEVDNPDERITEDVKLYTQTTLSFFLMTLNAVITSLAFLGVLWSITPWLVLVALIYAAAGSLMTILLGRPLVRLDNLQLQKEADLRYHLIQTRETAEAIATMGAARTARECLRARLAAVVANQKRIIAVTRNLGLFTNGYNYLTQLIPLVIVAPMYIQGRVDFGVVTQSAMAFSTFLSGFSLIITQFETLSSFAAVTNRLDTIAQALEQSRTPAGSEIQIVHDDTRVAYANLSLWSRHEHRPLIEDLTLEIVHGSSLLITGPDTAAEEALFMASAGLWDQGKGRIMRPDPQEIYFVPTQPLTVRCTVRSQLFASSPDRRFSDDETLAVLEKVGIAAAVLRVGGLDSDVHAPSALSPAEQRLLTFARVILASPRFVVLDRMGAVLNHEQLENVYRLLRETSISYLSIGDRHILETYHDMVLEIHGAGRWEVTRDNSPRGDGGPADGHLVTDTARGYP